MDNGKLKDSTQRHRGHEGAQRFKEKNSKKKVIKIKDFLTTGYTQMNTNKLKKKKG